MSEWLTDRLGLPPHAAKSQAACRDRQALGSSYAHSVLHATCARAWSRSGLGRRLCASEYGGGGEGGGEEVGGDGGGAKGGRGGKGGGKGSVGGQGGARPRHLTKRRLLRLRSAWLPEWHSYGTLVKCGSAARAPPMQSLTYATALASPAIRLVPPWWPAGTTFYHHCLCHP